MKKWCLKKKQRCLAYCFLITYFTLSFIGSIIGSDFLSILSLIVLGKKIRLCVSGLVLLRFVLFPFTFRSRFSFNISHDFHSWHTSSTFIRLDLIFFLSLNHAI